jgi:hypothetical protein
LQRDKLKVEKALRSKGFRTDDTHHRCFIYWTQDGKKTMIRTKTSHGSAPKALGDPLLGKMAGQCVLNKPEFLELVDCPMDRAAYESILSDKGVL